MRHNQIRDTGAQLISEVCKDVKIEPTLQTCNPELLPTISIGLLRKRLFVSPTNPLVRNQYHKLDHSAFGSYIMPSENFLKMAKRSPTRGTSRWFELHWETNTLFVWCLRRERKMTHTQGRINARNTSYSLVPNFILTK